MCKYLKYLIQNTNIMQIIMAWFYDMEKSIKYLLNPQKTYSKYKKD
jgi:hypothetical protein